MGGKKFKNFQKQFSEIKDVNSDDSVDMELIIGYGQRKYKQNANQEIINTTNKDNIEKILLAYDLEEDLFRINLKLQMIIKKAQELIGSINVDML